MHLILTAIAACLAHTRGRLSAQHSILHERKLSDDSDTSTESDTREEPRLFFWGGGGGDKQGIKTHTAKGALLPLLVIHTRTAAPAIHKTPRPAAAADVDSCPPRSLM
jgi:hypothetical protein